MNSSKWSVSGGGPVIDHWLTRKCDVARDQSIQFRVNFTVTSDLNWIRSCLRIDLQGFGLPREEHFVTGLFTAEKLGAFVEVKALHPEEDETDEDESRVCLVVNDDDVPKCLRALSSHGDLMFLLLNLPAGKGVQNIGNVDPIIAFRLPASLEFKKLSDEVCDKIRLAQNATWERHLNEGWFRRRSDAL